MFSHRVAHRFLCHEFGLCLELLGGGIGEELLERSCLGRNCWEELLVRSCRGRSCWGGAVGEELLGEELLGRSCWDELFWSYFGAPVRASGSGM